MYLAALLAPPLACILLGRFLHAVLNFVLCATVFGIPLAMVHAWMLVKESNRQLIGSRTDYYLR